MSRPAQTRAFGVAAGLPAEVCGPLAEACEESGYRSIWANDHPGAKGIDTLAEFAKTTSGIELGVAVIALDRQGPDVIAADIERSGIDPARLWIGVGAGFSKKPLTFMKEMLPELREKLPGIRIVMAAMGPKMCSFAGSSFDGTFFNWMTPGFAADARGKVEEGAAEAGVETPPVFGYVRTAIGDDSAARLAKEESFYRDLHKGYRDHFDRLGEPEGTVGVAASDRDDAQKKLAEYSALDVIVVRGLASARVEPMVELARAAAP
ncbi:MAG: LLM class flavin-dependent oxidoreductase [Actinomycetota bacterium]|nr:LLM class flavin-dependent oxidoreductase [Actinomycetota bacterium]